MEKAAVSAIVDAGNEVVFAKSGPLFLNVETVCSSCTWISCSWGRRRPRQAHSLRGQTRRCSWSRSVVVKSDNKPVIVDLVGCVVRVTASRCAQPLVIENSAVYVNASNGLVERCVVFVEGHVRVLRSHVDEVRMSVTPVGHIVWPWLVGHVAFLDNSGDVGHGGRTSCERCRGKRRRLAGAAFGGPVSSGREPQSQE